MSSLGATASARRGCLQAGRPSAPSVTRVKRRYGVRIHKWRGNMSGCAWQVIYADGHADHWVEAPHPKTPLSLSIFLHEVGHHVIGFFTYKLRCEEELRAWEWALEEILFVGRIDIYEPCLPLV